MHPLFKLCRAVPALLLLAATLVAPFAIFAQTRTKAANKSANKSVKGVAAVTAAPKVAFFAADLETFRNEVQSKLMSTGLFSQVDAYGFNPTCGGNSNTPTLAQLQQYAAVMVWGGCGFQDPTAMGNVLADYIDAGGGVVLAEMLFETPIALQGRLMSGGYYPLTIGSMAEASQQMLVKDLPAHPILQGVNSFDGGSRSRRATVSLTAGAQQVAHWTDNLPLVATKQITAGRVVALNMHPPSSAAGGSEFWNAATDGARLMANALLFAGRQLAPGDSPTAGQIVISEFRTSGPAGSRDEFIELYNATDSDIVINVNNTGINAGLTINTSSQGGGCVGYMFTALPNGTFIPARGHYLITNSQYSLGALAPSDVNHFSASNIDMADNTSLSLEKYESNPAVKIDRVGFGTNTCGGLFSEGTTLTPIDTVIAPSEQYSFVRKLASGVPQDTNDNAADFMLVSPTATVGSTQARLGASGPENLASPIQRNATIKGSLIDPNCPGGGSAVTACARVRTGEGANPTTSAYGELRLRRKFVNKTGTSVTRLRFRIADITTRPRPDTATADLRVVGGTGSFNVLDTNLNIVTIYRLTLETPPDQPNGGGFNSTLSANSITLSQPLAPNASINVEFILGVQEQGAFRFFINVEALP